MTRLAAAAPLLMLAVLFQTKGCEGSPARTSVSPTPAPATPAPPTPVPATPTAVPDLFATVIRPAVQAHCSPCHEPGGKMYGRLPFDDPKVLSSHAEGVLRRLKGADREAFERWVASLKPPG
jgi:mono/diheme cytochrome c family protein